MNLPSSSSTTLRLLGAAVGVFLLALPAASERMAPPTGGHASSTPQATWQYATSGPAAATLDYEVDLGFELSGEPRGAILAGNGLVVLRGWIATDLPDTPEDESRKSRPALVAIDPDDGRVAWKALDIEVSCAPAVTSDGRIIAQLDPDPGHDASIVALDEDTGRPISGQIYDGEVQDDDRLSACHRRLLLSDDESHVLVAGSFSFNRKIRAIDLAAWQQSWEIDLRNAEDHDSPPLGSQLVGSDAGDGFYVTLKWDDQPDPAVWRLLKFDYAGTPVAFVDLPGRVSGFQEGTLLAADGGVAMALSDCAGNPNETNECVVFYDDDGGGLFQRWIAYEPDEGGNNFFQTLARADGNTLVGWGEVESGADIAAIDTETGAVEWTHPTGDSNNGGQLVTDAAGNAYFGTFGRLHLASVSPDGCLRYEVPGEDLGEANEPDVLAAIAPDGTLVTTHADDEDDTEIVRGFRTGSRDDTPLATWPRNECGPSLTRLENAVEVSQHTHEDAGSAETVILATAFNWPHALVSGPLARTLDAPLLLTPPDELPPSVRQEIDRLGAGKAILVGSSAAIGSSVEETLRADMGLDVERIAGDNRFATAALVADRVGGTTVYVTEGANADPNRGWPNAMAVSGLASYEQRPILLVVRDVIPQETRDQLVELGATDVFVVGGTASVSDAVLDVLRDPDQDGTDDVTVRRISGENRFATSVELARASVAAGASTLDLWFATGLDFSDALVAGPAAARAGGILLLVDGQNPGGSPEVYEWLRSLDPDRTLRGTVVGDESAVVPAVARALAEAASIR